MNRMDWGRLMAVGMVAAGLSVGQAADDKEFSGPQAGEKLTPFKMRSVAGERLGQEIDLVRDASGKPLVMFFVHEVTRPALGLARQVLQYSASLQPDAPQAGLVLLSADATASEDWAKRASAALPRGVPVGVSLDGAEGPGAYGLNRKVAVTVLIAKENKVIANFALVQPSLAADGPKIAAAIAAACGKPSPTPAELERFSAPAR
jgi:hypothetical protein